MADLVYELSFKGTASSTLRAAFDDCELASGHGTTTLRCDQPELSDVLGRIQSLGLELLDLRLIAREGPLGAP
jgi:hypothetical protein